LGGRMTTELSYAASAPQRSPIRTIMITFTDHWTAALMALTISLIGNN
jgi:hypothetical protein